jgi:hypothetical protein
MLVKRKRGKLIHFLACASGSAGPMKNLAQRYAHGAALTVSAFMQKFAEQLRLTLARTAHGGLTNV